MLLLIDLFVPAEAAHPPGAPVVHVQHASRCRTERRSRAAPRRLVDADGRRIDIRSRYERRQRTAIIAREDETLALTWYTEDEIVALLRDAGYRDVTDRAARMAVDDETPEGERRFSVSATA